MYILNKEVITEQEGRYAVLEFSSEKIYFGRLKNGNKDMK